MQAGSLGSMFRSSCAKWADRPAMMMHEGSQFRTITYRELEEIVRGYASALESLGAKKGDRVVILSENCPEWAFVDWACQTLGVIDVPIYPTLPADQAQYIANDAGAAIAIVGGADQAAKLEGMPGLKVVPIKGEGSLDEMVAAPSGRLSDEEWTARTATVGPDDVATIIYTSGTTGQPKGAMLSNEGFTFLCRAALSNLPIDENDVFLCFLPMSHVLERFAGQTLPISIGASIGYAKNLMTLAADIVKVRPTVMLSVPRFLEATRDKIVDGVAKQPPLRQKLFAWALSQGTKRAQGKFAPLTGLLDSLVGKKIRERFGGRMRFFVSGGAALPQHVAEFYHAFGIKILQGYGLTETTAATCVNHPDRNRPETVGEVLEGMELRIAEDGEILVRGPAVMLGYHNLPEATAEAVDPEGWFHTGDIGEMDGKNLRITDRKKDILVLGNGKNVAPQPIENKLRESPFIAEAVVLGDGMEYCIGLLVPNEEAVRRELNLPAEAPLDTAPEVRALLKKEVDRINKTLAGYDMVKKFRILSRPFSVESGEMTPTLKIKRKVVKERYAKEIAALRG